MRRLQMSLLIFSLLVAAWAFGPMRYSHAAERATTRVETYSNSDRDSAPAVTEYNRETSSSSESRSSTVSPGGVEEKTEIESDQRSDMDAPAGTREYHYKREYRESTQVPDPPPVVHEYDRTIIVPDPPTRVDSSDGGIGTFMRIMIKYVLSGHRYSATVSASRSVEI